MGCTRTGSSFQKIYGNIETKLRYAGKGETACCLSQSDDVDGLAFRVARNAKLHAEIKTPDAIQRASQPPSTGIMAPCT